MGFDGAATFSGKNMVFKKLHMQRMSTVTDTSCNWLACKLPIAWLELCMSISCLTLTGSTFTLLLKEQILWKWSSMSLINQKWRLSTIWYSLACTWAVRKSSKCELLECPCTWSLGLYKALSKFTTIAGIYLLYYTLPLVASSAKVYKQNSLICLWYLLWLVQFSTHRMMPLITLTW